MIATVWNRSKKPNKNSGMVRLSYFTLQSMYKIHLFLYLLSYILCLQKNLHFEFVLCENSMWMTCLHRNPNSFSSSQTVQTFAYLILSQIIELDSKKIRQIKIKCHSLHFKTNYMFVSIFFLNVFLIFLSKNVFVSQTIYYSFCGVHFLQNLDGNLIWLCVYCQMMGDLKLSRIQGGYGFPVNLVGFVWRHSATCWPFTSEHHHHSHGDGDGDGSDGCRWNGGVHVRDHRNINRCFSTLHTIDATYLINRSIILIHHHRFHENVANVYYVRILCLYIYVYANGIALGIVKQTITFIKCTCFF